MIPKPSGCAGCPLYGDGLGFVPDEIVPGADTLIVMQGPDEAAEQQGRPAVGTMGDMLADRFLPRAGLVRGRTVSVASALRCRWLEPEPKAGTRIVAGKRHKASTKLPPVKMLNRAVEHCMGAHFVMPAEVTLLIAQGAVAFKALGNRESIVKWRGYLAPEPYRTEEA